MAVLIIGAGLVGSQVARILVEQGERPVLMDYAPQPAAIGQIVDVARTVLVPGDVLRPLVLMQVLKEHAVTGIVHTAANPMLTLGAQKDPFSAIQLNIMGTVNVMEAARIMGIKRVVVSSSNVLTHFLSGGDGSNDPAREEAFPRPTTFYASTKQAIESLGLNYARWCGLEFAAMRYGAVFGPWGGAGGGGPSNIIREALLRGMAGEEANLPASSMEWVYSKDAAMGTVQALQAKNVGTGVFNVTMGRLVRPQEMAEALQKVVPGVRVRIDNPAATAVATPEMKTASDLSTATAMIGFKPQFDLVEALTDMVGWLKLHQR